MLEPGQEDSVQKFLAGAAAAFFPQLTAERLSAS